MALTVAIESESLELILPDGAISGYLFSSGATGYAKSYPDYIKLQLDISVPALLGYMKAYVEDNEALVEKLRFWGNLKYEGSDPEYFRLVTLRHTFGDELFREIKLSHAYVKEYSEIVDISSRSHVIRLDLFQREDMLRYGEI